MEKKRFLEPGSKQWLPLIFIWFIATVLFPFPTARADLAHLKSGAVVDIGRNYGISGERLVVRKEAGTIAFPMSDVARIEKTEGQAESGFAPVRPTPEASTERAVDDSSEESRSEELRQRLVEIIREAMEFLQAVGPETKLSEAQQADGLESVSSWTRTVQSILEELGTGGDFLRDIGQEVLRGLEELQRELEAGALERGRDLETAFNNMLERLS